MRYAIIQKGGRQYKVTEGQEVLFDRFDGEAGKPVVFENILLARLDEQVIIGQPYLTDVKVSGQVIGEVKGDKIRVSKFKAKVRYDKTIGFRPKYTKVLIKTIGGPRQVKTVAPKNNPDKTNKAVKKTRNVREKKS